jgi:DHA2 family methylenomycin A resistance protein-like MFS transporter
VSRSLAPALPLAGVSIEAPAAARLVLVTLALGTTLAPLNSTMIAVALPDVQRAFGASVASVAFLVTIYLVAMAVGQPIGGRLGDMYGRRRLYLIGLVWFGVASIGCAFAGSLPLLIVFRAQQAMAGALALPNGVAIVRDVVHADRRGAAFGMIGMATGLAAALGPPLGGVLVHGFGWQAIFWANVPIILITVVLGARLLPSAERPAAARPSFDLLGSGLLALSLAAVVIVPTLLKSRSAPSAALAIVAGIAGAVLFVRRERSNRAPVVDVRLFRTRNFAAACASIYLSNLVMYTTLLALPLYLERVRDHGARTTGLILASMSFLMAMLGPISGRLADSRGRRGPAVLGALALAAGVALLAFAVLGSPLWPVAGALAVMGVGLGLQSAPIQTTAVEAVPAAKTGSAAGVYSTARYLGSVSGATVLAIAFTDPGAGDAARFATLVAGLAVVAALGSLANFSLQNVDRSPDTAG